jgi:hypothetical protein
MIESGMTPFQVITIIISGLGLLFAIIAVFIKAQIEIAKIQTSITFIQKDLDGKEGSILRLEKENKQDHNIILDKIETLIKNQNGK